MRKAMEDELRLAWRLAALHGIHAGVSHDIKSPINAIVLNLELLKRAVAGDLPTDEALRAKQQRWLGVVDQELGRLRRALDVILAVTAPPDEAPQRFNLQEILEEVEAMVYPQTRQQKVSLEVERAPAPVHVLARRDVARQAVLSLAVRALGALSEGQHLRLGLTTGEGRARLSVTDGGTPLVAADRDLVAGGPAVAAGHDGHLAAAVLLAADLGGRVALGDGEGTVIELTMPLAERGS